MMSNKNIASAKTRRNVDWLGSLNAALAGLLTWIAMVMMALLVVDVIWGVATRYLLGDQAKWTEELARFLLIWVSLLGGGIAYRNKEHLGIDFLTIQFDHETQRFVKLLTEAIALVLIGSVLVFGGIRLVYDALVAEQLTPALGWPMAVVYSVVPLVGVLMLLFSLESMMFHWNAEAATLASGKSIHNVKD